MSAPFTNIGQQQQQQQQLQQQPATLITPSSLPITGKVTTTVITTKQVYYPPGTDASYLRGDATTAPTPSSSFVPSETYTPAPAPSVAPIVVPAGSLPPSAYWDFSKVPKEQRPQFIEEGGAPIAAAALPTTATAPATSVPIIEPSSVRSIVTPSSSSLSPEALHRGAPTSEIPILPPPPAPLHHHENVPHQIPSSSLAPLSENVPVPPPLPPVTRARAVNARGIRPHVKYGKRQQQQPIGFTLLIKQMKHTLPHSRSFSRKSLIPTPPPLPPVYQYPTSRIHPYVKYGKELVQPVAFTIALDSLDWEHMRSKGLIEVASEWKNWGLEKAVQAKDTAKSAVTHTGDYVGEKILEATAAAVHTGEYLGEKAVHAGEVVKETAVQAKETIVPAAIHTGEYLEEKAVQAKDTIVPAAIHTGEFLGEKAVQAKDTIVPAAIETGEYLEEKAEELLPVISSWTEWTMQKAAELEHAAMIRGKNILGMAASAIYGTRAHIPVPPPRPPVYHTPKALRFKKTPYVKLGQGMSNLAFTTVLLRSVERIDAGPVARYGKRPSEEARIPPIPETYKFPVSKRLKTPYVKYGKGQSNIAFTSLIPQVVSQSDISSTSALPSSSLPTSLSSSSTAPLATAEGNDIANKDNRIPSFIPVGPLPQQ